MNTYSLPLFPLNVVVCPDGLMRLRIFEARYLDMIKACLKHQTRFAMVAALPASALPPASRLPFAEVATVLDIIDADVTTVGLIMVTCRGSHRVHIHDYSVQADGLVVGEVSDIANDMQVAVPEDLKVVSASLQQLIAALPRQGYAPEDIPILKPYHFQDAAWVANRWLELLDLSLIEKQRLMQIDSPIVRLELIYDALNLKVS